MYTYPLSLTVPANTPQSSALNVIVNAGSIRIVSGRLSINPGAAGLLYVRLRTRSTPIYPANGSYINGDGDDFTFETYIRMEGPPWQICLEAYNLDDTFQHSPSALVAVDSERAGQ